MVIERNQYAEAHWMSDEQEQDSKTQDATPKQIEKFRKEGNLAFSKEVTAACGLGAVVLVLVVMGTYTVEQVDLMWKEIGSRISSGPKGNGLIDRQLFVTVMGTFAKILAPPAILGSIAILLSGATQTKLNWSTKAITPKLSKFNPIPKLKRMFFSVEMMVEVTRSIAKLIVLGAVAVAALWDRTPMLARMPHVSVRESLSIAGGVMAQLFVMIGSVAAAMAVVDYIWQKHQLTKKMRMTFQQIKDEYKETEGDPLIKGSRRQRMREMAMERSKVQLASEASVVIVNPTHISIALRFEPGQDHAPRILCMGKDQIAAEIRSVARRSGVPVVQRISLARLMFKTCKSGQEIPADLYEAVAQVLALVMRLKNRRR